MQLFATISNLILVLIISVVVIKPQRRGLLLN